MKRFDRPEFGVCLKTRERASFEAGRHRKTRLPRVFKRVLRTITNDVRGTSLIEFAILLPALLLLFLGGYQLSDASACKRRVTIVTRAVADLVAQDQRVTKGDVDTIMSASAQIMAPYSITPAKMRVSEITVDGSGKPQVSWSRVQNATALTAGDDFDSLPHDMRIAGVSYIYSEVTYVYNPLLQNLLPGVTFSQSLYMLPRKSTQVELVA